MARWLFALAAIGAGAALVNGHGAPVPLAVSQTAAATTTPIRHVVVIYQENHSFDETLGALCVQSRPTRCDGHIGAVTLKDGTVVQMRQSPDVVPAVDHSVPGQARAIDGGAMDGWASLHGCTAADKYGCLTYYTPTQIPNLSQLASRFAISDHTFSMADSPSWGGHLYAATATLDGFLGGMPKQTPGLPPGPGWGCDSNKQTPWSPDNGITPYRKVPSCIPKPDGSGSYLPKSPVPYVPTIFDALDKVHLTYKIYGETAGGSGGYGWSICPSLAECLGGPQKAALVPTAKVLTDAANGTLPSYSILTPSSSSSAANGGQTTSQHNGRSMLAGDNWIGKVVSAIEGGPEWRSTAIFITYDDCGCFYDHVAPPANPDGTQEGPRVPMVIVSPYAKAGFTDSNTASFASILKFTEENFGLSALNANDANAYDYSNAFNYSQAPLAPLPMVTSDVPAGSRGLVDPTDDPT